MTDQKTFQNIFLQGKKTYLRPLEPSDAPAITQWLNSGDVRQFILRQTPLSLEEERQWLGSTTKDQSGFHLGICTLEGRLIGVMGLSDVDWRNRVATTGSFIGEAEYRGKGLGTDAKMALLEWAFMTLGLNRINSYAIAYNGRSVAYSQKCGYVIEGRQRKATFSGGRFHDRVVLGVLKKDWLPLYRKWKRS